MLSGCTFLLLALACLAFYLKPVKKTLYSRTAQSVVKLDSIHPKTLDELLALDPSQLEKVDIALINLLCAVGLRGSENLNVEECLKILDAWACHVERETKRNFHHFVERPEECNNSLAYYRMGMMATVLVQDMKVQYNPEIERQQNIQNLNTRTVQQWSAFFSNSRDVFLHGLLSGKRYGTCSSMPFLYVAIGRRLGYRVTIAARKFHLYARYEEDNGKHLNIEATENMGISTPSDEEYRKLEYSMTDEEIQGCGWFRPLSNKEVLGICLQIRSGCLRSMKRYDDEVATLTQALRYVPDTPLMRRVISGNQQLSKCLALEDRCKELLNEFATIQFPISGPKCGYFQNRKLQVQLLLSRSTNMVEVMEAVSGLLVELKEYRTQLSDFPDQARKEFSPAVPPPMQQNLFAELENVTQGHRVRLPEEKVPVEYWERIPGELMKNLRKLNRSEDMLIVR